MSCNTISHASNQQAPNWRLLPESVLEHLMRFHSEDLSQVRLTCKKWRELCDRIVRFLRPRRLPAQLGVHFPNILQIHVDFALMSAMPRDAGAILASLPRLRVAAIWGVRCGEEEYLRPLARRSDLEIFQLSFGVFSSHPTQCHRAIESLGTFGALTHLQLPRQPWIVDADLAQLVGLTRLQVLDVAGHQRICGSGLTALAKLPLRELSLTMTDCEGAYLRHLCPLPQLRRLDLSHCHALRGGEFGQLKHFTRLIKLGVARTKITDEDLAEWTTLRALQELNVSGCQAVTERGIAQLTGLTDLKHLKVIAKY